jgi:hypothetical protein
MTYLHVLEIAGHWAAIGTAVVAIIAYAGYLFDRFRKMKKLEDYLRAETKSHSVTHLTAQLGMTEDEIFQASFRSKHITPSST